MANHQEGLVEMTRVLLQMTREVRDLVGIGQAMARVLLTNYDVAFVEALQGFLEEAQITLYGHYTTARNILSQQVDPGVTQTLAQLLNEVDSVMSEIDEDSDTESEIAESQAVGLACL